MKIKQSNVLTPNKVAFSTPTGLKTAVAPWGCEDKLASTATTGGKPSLAKHSDTKFVVVYSASPAQYQVYTLTAGKWSAGPLGTLTGVNMNQAYLHQFIKVTDTTYLLVYNNGSNVGYAMVCSFDVNTGILLPGTPVQVTAATMYNIVVAPITATTFLCTFEKSTGTISSVVLSVVGSAVSVGTALAGGTHTGSYPCHGALLSSTRGIHVGQSGQTINVGVFTIASTTLTATSTNQTQTDARYTVAASYPVLLFPISAIKVVLIYVEVTTYALKAGVLDLSGANPIWGAPITLLANSNPNATPMFDAVSIATNEILIFAGQSYGSLTRLTVDVATSAMTFTTTGYLKHFKIPTGYGGRAVLAFVETNKVAIVSRNLLSAYEIRLVDLTRLGETTLTPVGIATSSTDVTVNAVVGGFTGLTKGAPYLLNQETGEIVLANLLLTRYAPFTDIANPPNINPYLPTIKMLAVSTTELLFLNATLPY